MSKNLVKHTILVCVFLFTSVFAASSQVKLGVKAGYDVVSNKINKNILKDNNRLGFQIGPTLLIPLPLTGFGIDVGVMYGYKKYELKENVENDLDISNYHYITTPIYIKKDISILDMFGIYGKAGAYTEFKLSGGDFDFKGDIRDKIKSKSFGAGLNFGLGVKLFDRVDVGMDYRFKLTDNYDEDKIESSSFKNKKDKTWNVNITCFF